jgi:hypothetical protein
VVHVVVVMVVMMMMVVVVHLRSHWGGSRWRGFLRNCVTREADGESGGGE